MLESVDHLIVGVRDLAGAERRIGSLLGRRASWRGEHPGAGTANVLFRLRNTYLELLAPTGSGAFARALETRIPDGAPAALVGIAFGTRDAKATAAELAAAGLHPAPPERGMGRDSESGAFREWTRVVLPDAETRGPWLFAIEHHSPAELLPPAPPLGAAAACADALDHVVLQSADPDATRALYGERLGLRLALDREFPQWGSRLIFFRVGGVTVEVAARLDAERDPAARDQLWGFTFRVGDADAAHARLAEAGFDLSAVRPGRKPGTRVFSVRGDTCGIPTLILEPPAGD